jgi:glyoxylase-like metal-dependent hydrolase (beta-lactamase superfamily II)
MKLWDGSHAIDANLTLELAAGHTPGSSVLWLESGTDRAALVGDLMHTPIQVVEPELNSCFCEDEGQARASRRRVLERAADTGALVLPAHFGGQGAVEVRRDGSKFAISEWAGFDRV